MSPDLQYRYGKRGVPFRGHDACCCGRQGEASKTTTAHGEETDKNMYLRDALYLPGLLGISDTSLLILMPPRIEQHYPNCRWEHWGLLLPFQSASLHQTEETRRGSGSGPSKAVVHKADPIHKDRRKAGTALACPGEFTPTRFNTHVEIFTRYFFTSYAWN